LRAASGCFCGSFCVCGPGARKISLSTAVLPKIPHCNSSKSVPNRPLRGRGGRFGTLLGQLECGIFGRTAVCQRMIHCFIMASCGAIRDCIARVVQLETHWSASSLPFSYWLLTVICLHFFGLEIQPFSQKSHTPTVAKEFQIDHYDPTEADLEHFWNSCSEGFLGERLYAQKRFVVALRWYCGGSCGSVWSLRQKLDSRRQADRRLGQSNAQKRLFDRPGLSTFWRNDNRSWLKRLCS